MPGIENVKVDPKDVARKRAMVLSMTPAERENPDLLNPSRRRRIAYLVQEIVWLKSIV